MDELKTPVGKMTVMVTALVSTCFTLAALIPVAYMAYKHIPPPLVTIDLQKIVEENQLQLIEHIGTANSNGSEEKRAMSERMAADFAQRLSKNVTQLSEECQCVLINKAALLSETPIDYTDLLNERMKQ
jgi:hypothetical protein